MLQLYEFVGLGVRFLQVAVSVRPLQVLFQRRERVVPALCLVHFFVEVLHVFRFARDGKGADLFRQVVGSRHHVLRGGLAFDVLLRRVLHDLVTVRDLVRREQQERSQDERNGEHDDVQRADRYACQ